MSDTETVMDSVKFMKIAKYVIASDDDIPTGKQDHIPNNEKITQVPDGKDEDRRNEEIKKAYKERQEWLKNYKFKVTNSVTANAEAINEIADQISDLSFTPGVGDKMKELSRVLAQTYLILKNLSKVHHSNTKLQKSEVDHFLDRIEEIVGSVSKVNDNIEHIDRVKEIKKFVIDVLKDAYTHVSSRQKR